jgi:hypothetical protein
MEGKPENVRRAVLADDREVLSRMGRKSARQKQLKQIQREREWEVGMQQNRIQANEHIADPDD